MFSIGQRVVCIATDDWDELEADERGPICGHIYTIRGINSNAHIGPDEPLGLLLFEIVNPPHSHLEGFVEADFDSSWFRPIIERKTDISILEALLLPTDKREVVS